MFVSMNSTLFFLGNRAITALEAAVAAGLILLVCLLLLLISARAQLRRSGDAEIAAGERIEDLEGHLSKVMQSQGEISGRMQTMAEIFGSRQSDMMRAVNERLDGMGQRLGNSMVHTTKQTHEGLRQLHERLAVIDRAQQTITDLSGQVVELQSILANKQTRGAFGQGRMELIIQDQLPSTGYSFQATLSTGVRPDCLIYMPNGAPPLAIDAKFPLEAFQLIRKAETEEGTRAGSAQFRRDFTKHIGDIKDKYLIPGETQDTAFLFVPSESIFAELHERFEDLIQKAHRSRVVIVSPSLLMLSIQVIQAVLRDAKMREQAHLIQAEVTKLLDDVGRLNDRVGKLQTHFTQANRDIDQILVSTDKISRRGQRIEDLELGEASREVEADPATSDEEQFNLTSP
ncbi:DNA recombination protein RmuC [Roseibium limicola]